MGVIMLALEATWERAEVQRPQNVYPGFNNPESKHTGVHTPYAPMVYFVLKPIISRNTV